MRLPTLAARVFGVPLMIDPGKARAIMQAVGHKFTGQSVLLQNFGERMGVLGDPLGSAFEQVGRGDRLLPQVQNGIATIAIEGTLVHKGKFIGMDSGETSYEGIQAQVRRAMRDPGILGVVFEIDSFGGEVSGAFDTAELIAELSKAKPTLAILTDYALSAAYLLASACRAIVAPPTGYAGSIGVITMHVDESAALEQEGIKVTLITAGAHKADGNPYEALSPEVLGKIQADVNSGRDAFATFVGKARAGKIDKAGALATEAQYYRAGEAKALGLIDEVARPSVAYGKFMRAVNQNS